MAVPVADDVDVDVDVDVRKGANGERANSKAVSQSSNLRGSRERTTEGQHAIHIHSHATC